MKTLIVKHVQDRHGNELCVIESEPFNGLEIYPEQLRQLAYALGDVAKKAEERQQLLSHLTAREKSQLSLAKTLEYVI